MRILLITDNHTPTGGAENYFFELKNRLSQREDLEVYSLGFAPQPETGNDFQVLKRAQSKFMQLVWRFFVRPSIASKLRKQIQAVQPDVIHLHNIKQYTASVLQAVKSYPVVQTIHDYSVICPTANNIHQDLQPCTTGLRKECFWQHKGKFHIVSYLLLSLSFLLTKRRLKKTIRHFFAPSPLLVDYLQKNHFYPATYIPPFKNKKQTPCFENINPFHFLFAGNLGAHKGIYILLDEFALAVAINPNLTLTIAGMGTEEKQIRARIKTLHCEKNITLIGWQKNLGPEYLRAAAVIFPSLCFEAFGLVMTEAMSYARPVIGSNRGTSAWIIDDKHTGLTFDPLKKGDLAEKILMLAGNKEWIKQLGRNGETKLQTFLDNEKALNELTAVYKELASASSL